ncbi:unnamed protein product [Colias eurytheme]|nr:unnamed protein product [Colias eurytheme]
MSVLSDARIFIDMTPCRKYLLVVGQLMVMASHCGNVPNKQTRIPSPKTSAMQMAAHAPPASGACNRRLIDDETIGRYAHYRFALIKTV